MKNTLAILFALLSINSFAQDKNNYVTFNTLTPVQGTPYTIASSVHRGKAEIHSSHLMFINTLTGQTVQQDFPADAYIADVKQIHIDSLGLHKVLIAGRTINLDNNKSIDWNDPFQVYICSVDGTGRVQITDDRFFADHWQVNPWTGVIVITGHRDTNTNGKLDKTDLPEIIVYDLNKMALVKKI